jgi:hypothetical protein
MINGYVCVQKAPFILEITFFQTSHDSHLLHHLAMRFDFEMRREGKAGEL